MIDSEKVVMQGRVESLLKSNPSKSYSREEIINLLSADNRSIMYEIEKILGELEIGSSMKDMESSVYSSCKGGTVYFRWGSSP
jgi:hypothetical protein